MDAKRKAANDQLDEAVMLYLASEIVGVAGVTNESSVAFTQDFTVRVPVVEDGQVIERCYALTNYQVGNSVFGMVYVPDVDTLYVFAKYRSEMKGFLDQLETSTNVIEDGIAVPWEVVYTAQRIMTKRGGHPVLHFVIQRRDGGEVRATWSELQAIKNEIVGENVDMFEVYPRMDNEVNEVNKRHLWSFLPGMVDMMTR